MFEVIATTVDGQVPTGEHWHQLLLEQMASEIRGARPAVISDETCQGLDEYRGFRYIVRNVYTFCRLTSRIPACIIRMLNKFVVESMRRDEKWQNHLMQ
jgi:hypothetical protein